jgi:hypothetical protein
LAKTPDLIIYKYVNWETIHISWEISYKNGFCFQINLLYIITWLLPYMTKTGRFGMQCRRKPECREKTYAIGGSRPLHHRSDWRFMISTSIISVRHSESPLLYPRLWAVLSTSHFMLNESHFMLKECHMNVTLYAQWVSHYAQWVSHFMLNECHTLCSMSVTLCSMSVTLYAQWVALYAQWVSLYAQWVSLYAQWVSHFMLNESHFMLNECRPNPGCMYTYT